jgi:chemotaxis family two-component system sensor kinase Cph1
MSAPSHVRPAPSVFEEKKDEEIDPSECAQEPIHRPDAVQPHGVLLVLDAKNQIIRAISENCVTYLGRTFEALLGESVQAVMQAEDLPAFVQMLNREPALPYNPFKMSCLVGGKMRVFDAVLHRYRGALILELEPTTKAVGEAFVNVYQETRAAVNKLRQAEDLKDLTAILTQQIRLMTNFDRVCVYRFDSRYNGQVISESRKPGATSFLGYHFPEGDIPQQARQLYKISPIRAVPDVMYEPAPLRYASSYAKKDRPVDLTMAVLRSLSPKHRDYTKNMGVQASMSVSLLHDGELWGLLICGHESGTLHIPYELRTACEFLCEVTTSLIGAKTADSDKAYRTFLSETNAALLEQMFQDQDIVRGLCEHATDLRQVCAASGAVIFIDGKLTCLGVTPAEAEIKELIDWLSRQELKSMYVTDSLSVDFTPAQSYIGMACGLLAAPLSGSKNSFLLWFRGEQEVRKIWAGDPTKDAKTSSGKATTPRPSFKAHEQVIRLQAKPWETLEKEAVAELRRVVVDVVLQHNEALKIVNTELSRSNVELDAFAYAASHDLKEPLRGMKNFSSLILRDADPALLDHDNRYRLQSIVGMAQRMQELIDALLHYAHVGRAAIRFRDVSIDAILQRIDTTLEMRLKDGPTALIVQKPLPSVQGDPTLIEELFTNLLTNAIKYNDKPEPWIKIDHEPLADTGEIRITVRDNGIGISQKNHTAVFQIFRRLHARDRFGGGTGAGLTIAKRIVERHGGTLSLTSKIGEGTAFSFTLKATRTKSRSNGRRR